MYIVNVKFGVLLCIVWWLVDMWHCRAFTFQHAPSSTVTRLRVSTLLRSSPWRAGYMRRIARTSCSVRLPNTPPSSNVVHVALAVEYEGCSLASFVRGVNACAVRVEAVWCLERTDAPIVVCGWLCCIT